MWGTLGILPWRLLLACLVWVGEQVLEKKWEAENLETTRGPAGEEETGVDEGTVCWLPPRV